MFVDTRIENATVLKKRGAALLERLKNPTWSYSVAATDLHKLTDRAWDTHMPGKMVTVSDDDRGTRFTARIVDISKGDVYGAPSDIQITIANAPLDVAGSINQIADRVGIAELYSQGATNQYAQQFADNADTGHPAIMRVYVPAGCVRINQMLLSWQLSAFRAYATGAEVGGSVSTTTGVGGTTSVSASATVTLDGGVGFNTDASSLTVTEPPSGNYEQTTGEATADTDGSRDYTGNTDGGDSHSHYMYHSHDGHPHAHPIGAHRHYMSHTHSLYHSHTIPGHSHSFPGHSHTVNLPAHGHEMVHGIYEGGQASYITLRIDGKTVPAAQVRDTELNIVPWLAKDADGKITRGTWHTVELVPDKLTRIEANLFVQTFVQSVGGGDY